MRIWPGLPNGLFAEASHKNTLYKFSPDDTCPLKSFYAYPNNRNRLRFHWSLQLNGYTAIFFAALSNRADIVAFLLEAGANKEIRCHVSYFFDYYRNTLCTNCMAKTVCDLMKFISPFVPFTLIFTDLFCPYLSELHAFVE